ncbi:MAG TPA: transcription antitermination factor NusB [bacterium]|nr:transcription antitermination factor NusB [Myxococcales bacterium]OQA59228.1 MAG: hypothetical protein BWY40_01221 [bacterium ADurb.Bin270]HPW46172.1 transcription antitermination factor NusB [bacterium]
MGIRRKARECVVQMLYQLDVGGEDARMVRNNFWRGNEFSSEVVEFANVLFDGVVSNIEKIDSSISDNSTNWKISRMAAVDKSVLRVSVYELLFRVDIPIKVSINEAVEIAKRFGTSESGAFVNGILDNIAKTSSLPKKADRENEND